MKRVTATPPTKPTRPRTSSRGRFVAVRCHADWAAMPAMTMTMRISAATMRSRLVGPRKRRTRTMAAADAEQGEGERGDDGHDEAPLTCSRRAISSREPNARTTRSSTSST